MALSPQARALLEASRKTLRSTTADRERIEAALRLRLGPAALPEAGGLAPSPRAFGWQAAAGVAAGVCVIAAVALFSLREVPPTREPAPQQTVQPPAPASPQHGPVLAPQPSAAGAPAPPTIVTGPKRRPPRAARPRDRLADELTLLARATSELRAGHATAALTALEEHQRKFPSGALREERRAAKAQALCALGRVREGEAELAGLPPQFPAAQRARQLCRTPSSPR